MPLIKDDAEEAFVYIVEIRQFNHHTDTKGTFDIVGVYADAEEARTFADEEIRQRSEVSDQSDPECNIDEEDDGAFRATCYIQTAECDHFTLTIVRHEVRGVKQMSSPAKQPVKATTQEDKTENAESKKSTPIKTEPIRERKRRR